jgi:hypothetical protein
MAGAAAFAHFRGWRMSSFAVKRPSEWLQAQVKAGVLAIVDCPHGAVVVRIKKRLEGR